MLESIHSMLPDIENLLRLQDTDKEIRRLQDEVAEFPKRVAVIEQKLAGTKAQLVKAQTAVKADEAARRKYDTAINDLRGKISKYRDQSLDVKTNDQYRALLHEIQFAEKEIAANEDKILEMMVNADARDKEVKAAQAELKAETAEIEKEKEEARQLTAKDEKLLAEWRAQRDQIRTGINDDLLRHYERVSKFRGSGISEVRDQKCMACRVMLRPQTHHERRSRQHTTECVPASSPSLAPPGGPSFISTPPPNWPIKPLRPPAPNAIIPKSTLPKPGTTARNSGGSAKYFSA